MKEGESYQLLMRCTITQTEEINIKHYNRNSIQSLIAESCLLTVADLTEAAFSFHIWNWVSWSRPFTLTPTTSSSSKLNKYLVKIKRHLPSAVQSANCSPIAANNNSCQTLLWREEGKSYTSLWLTTSQKSTINPLTVIVFVHVHTQCLTYSVFLLAFECPCTTINITDIFPNKSHNNSILCLSLSYHIGLLFSCLIKW